MATTISNPATFSSVRSAFSAEGYGTSTSFFAYRQGGGIVPATSAFNVIGAGTAGDPLQLSQFSGFTVPSQTPVVSLGNHILDTAAEVDDGNTTSATTYFRMNSDGTATYQYSFGGIDETPINGAYLDNVLIATDSGTSTIETWLDSGAASDVSIYVTATGSSLLFGSSALNTYLSLGTSRYFAVRASRTASGTTSASTVLTVSLVSTSNTSNVLDTASINIVASATAA